jgi:cobalamin biosynthesis protein CobT
MSKDFLSSLPIVAGALGSKWGIQLIWSGGIARTDGSTITLPEDYVDNATYRNIVLGFLAHEAAHIRYTDFSNPSQTKLQHDFTNIFEDVRIETKMAQEFPGVRNWFQHMNNELEETGKLCAPENHESEITVLVGYLLIYLNAKLDWGGSLIKHVAMATTTMRHVFGDELTVKLTNKLDKDVPTLASTEDAKQLARWVTDLLVQVNEANQASEQQHGDTDDVRDAGSALTEPSPDQKKGAEAVSRLLEAYEAKQWVPEVDKGRMMVRVIDQVLEESLKDETLCRVPDEFRNSNTLKRLDPKTADNELQLVRRKTMSLSTKLRGIVEAEGRARKRTSSAGRRVNVSQLPRLKVGDTRVFNQRSIVRAVDTAIMLVVDRSLSMCIEERQVLANQSALALAAALEPIANVQCGAMTFGDGELTQPIGAAVQQYAGRITGVKSGGNTPLVEALVQAASQLSERREHRKVIIVLTDGKPTDQKDLVSKVIKDLVASKIDIYGIGIQTDAVEKFFSINTVVEHVEDLPRAVFEMAEKALLSPA